MLCIYVFKFLYQYNLPLSEQHMLDEIRRKYVTFGDAQILNVSFRSGERHSAIVQIVCSNKENNWKWDTINLIFTDVLKFKFIQHEQRSSTVLFQAYLNRENDKIVVDFFAEQEDGKREYEHSDFVIHSKEISYEVVNTDTGF